MAEPENNAPSPKPEVADDNLMGKLRALPPIAKGALGLVLVGILYLILGGGSDNNQQGGAINMTSEGALQGDGVTAGDSKSFQGIESDRPALMQGWLEQNRREMSEIKTTIQSRFEEKDKALAEALKNNADMQSQMRQMMQDFTAEIKNIQSSSQKDREMLGQLAEEQRKASLNIPIDGIAGGVGPISRQSRRIEQKPLAGGGTNNIQGQALLSPLTRAINSQVEPRGGGRLSTDDPEDSATSDDREGKLPFVPPLGFIKGTMLNGVDALVGGQPTPALVRLSGNYKTAMGTSVNLDGCYALVEFQGEISTERAVGKPARMTCVYPDQGAVTYSLSGYIVDMEDGIIGVPGVFYEGDASRIAAAMLADFAAGVGSIVKENQNTTTVTTSGATVDSLTGSELQSQVAGGVEKAVGSLRDYLLQRMNRVLPFVRLDSTRQIHLVFLSGTELRAEGSPWTLLFDAESADQARANAATNSNNQEQAGSSVNGG